MHYVLLFLAGLLACNSIPHLAAGLRGEPFPTPFAKPRGVGLSSPVVNVVWGSANLAAASAIALRAEGFAAGADLAAAVAGFVLAALYLSRHFGRLRGGGP